MLSGPKSASSSSVPPTVWSPGLLDQGRHQVVVDARRGQHPGGRRAVLAGVEVAGDGDALGRRREVGVVEDDHRRLAAELEVDPLDVRAADAATSMPARTLPVIDTMAGTGARPGPGRCPGRRTPR